jgi:hypothetical protein
MHVNYFLALSFGLIHGLAFATTLKWLLSKDQNFVTAWLSFSIGLELGQIVVVLLILLLAQVFLTYLRLKQHYWVSGISVAVMVLALQMAISRWPWKKSTQNGIAHSAYNTVKPIFQT